MSESPNICVGSYGLAYDFCVERERLMRAVGRAVGELSAMEWLGSQGYSVYVQVGHSPDVDLIASDGEALLRVQVKTSAQHGPKGRWRVAVCTRGGNQSWNGVVKRFSATRCDWLFVLVADGRRWFIPAGAIEGGTALNLGGPKYSEFEVQPGRPFSSSGGP